MLPTMITTTTTMIRTAGKTALSKRRTRAAILQNVRMVGFPQHRAASSSSSSSSSAAVGPTAAAAAAPFSTLSSSSGISDISFALSPSLPSLSSLPADYSSSKKEHLCDYLHPVHEHEHDDDDGMPSSTVNTQPSYFEQALNDVLRLDRESTTITPTPSSPSVSSAASSGHTRTTRASSSSNSSSSAMENCVRDFFRV